MTMSYKAPNVPLMSYDEVRGNVRNGDYLLCSGNGKISKAIGWFTESDFTHIASLQWVEGCLVVHESVEGQGVRPVALSNYVKDLCSSGKGYNGRLFLYRHKRLDPTDKVRMERTFRWAIEKLATKYDKMGLVKVGWTLLKFKLGFRRKRKMDRNELLFCSEYRYEWDKIWDGDNPILRISPDTLGHITPTTYAMNPDVQPYAEIRSER